MYAMDPGLRDVIVEGRTDRDFLRLVLRRNGIRFAEVYAVDDRVEVTRDIVLDAGGEVGAKGRVLGLANEASTWGLATTGLTCIVDTDRDALAASVLDFPHLLRTDVGSLDVYSFQARPLEKFLIGDVGIDVDPVEIIESSLPLLRELFLVRAALHHVCQARMVKDFARCCTFSGGDPTINVGEIVRRSLDKAGARGMESAVMGELERLRERLPADPLMSVHGHDIAPLLIGRLRLRNDMAKPEIVESKLRLCVELEDLNGFPLFQELLRRTA